MVSVGDEVEALVLTKEDKEGRLILSKEARPVRARLGHDRGAQGEGQAVKGTVIEVVKGGLILDIGLRGFLPASLVEMRRVQDLQPYIGRRSRPRSSSWTRTATTWSCPGAPGSSRPSRRSAASS